jgi:hypothetical protein
MALYVVSVPGFDDQTFETEKPKGAKWRNLKALREAGYYLGRKGFRDYVKAARVSPAPDAAP